MIQARWLGSLLSLSMSVMMALAIKLFSQKDLGARYALAERMFPSGKGGDSELFATML